MSASPVKLVRHDLSGFVDGKDKDRFRGSERKEVVEQVEFPVDKESFFRINLLPVDSIVKVKADGKLIPWSLLPLSADLEVEIHVLRPHQNVKPRLRKYVEGDAPFRKTVARMESRVVSLEEAASHSVSSAKTEIDLEKLWRQVGFLRRRMEEAEKAEWLKNKDVIN